jgi:hypothetical protein
MNTQAKNLLNLLLILKIKSMVLLENSNLLEGEYSRKLMMDYKKVLLSDLEWMILQS